MCVCFAFLVRLFPFAREMSSGKISAILMLQVRSQLLFDYNVSIQLLLMIQDLGRRPIDQKIEWTLDQYCAI